jgi:phasin family protein
MFEAFTKQWQQGLKPMTELVAVNAKALEQLSKQQTELFNNTLQGNVEYSQELSQQQDITGLMAIQKDYVSKLQSSFSQAGAEVLELAINTKGEAQQALSPLHTEDAPTAETPPAKKATPKKATAIKTKKAPLKAEPTTTAE